MIFYHKLFTRPNEHGTCARKIRIPSDADDGLEKVEKTYKLFLFKATNFQLFAPLGDERAVRVRAHLRLTAALTSCTYRYMI